MEQEHRPLKSRRWGAGTAAVMRSLIRLRRPVSGKELARQTGVSQPRAVQILQMLGDHGVVSRTEEGFEGDAGRLFDLYLARTKPTVESESFWYSPVGLMAQARTVVPEVPVGLVGFSADVACDLIAPWRNPTIALFYSTKPLHINPAEFVRAAGMADATLVVRVVKDRTLYPSWSGPGEWSWTPEIEGIPIIDPIQQWHDLLTLGGEDRVEAAGVLKSVILRGTSV